MLLPSTYALDATPALIMLAGIYYGAQYGGSTTAILINVPGESSSVVTAIDGYQMARQGRAGAALAAAGARLVLRRLRRHDHHRRVRAAAHRARVQVRPGRVLLADGARPDRRGRAGVGLADQGDRDDHPRPAARRRSTPTSISGTARYSFDIPQLTDGIGFVVIAMGVFGFGEIIANLGQPAEHREVFTKQGQGPAGRRSSDFRRPGRSVLRGTALGSILGVLPGGGALLASFASYTVEKKMSRNPRIAVRQGRDPGRRRPGVGQQRRRADLVHPDADARHPAQRGDGADGRRDDDQGHPARPAGDDREPAAVLGPDRLDVGRQR